MAEVLLRMLAGVTLGLVLVLLLRRPARGAFGPGPAFTLWLLPAELALAPLLPQRLAPAALALPPVFVTPHVAAAAHAVAVGWCWWLVAAWSAGAVSALAWLAVGYARLLRGARSAPPSWAAVLREAAPCLAARRVRVHAAGPALLCALPQALVLLPEDFCERFGNASTRALVLRHELAHARRGDAWWSLAMEVAAALLWFHPLAWLARPRFRLDQELACDAATLRDAPAHAARYARALLDSVGVEQVPALIPWLTEPQLKERIAMITRNPPGALRRRAGFVLAAAVLACGLCMAAGQSPAQAAVRAASASTAPSVDVSYKNRNPPHYPEDAIRNGEQGTVTLRVRVAADGSIADVEIDRADTTTSSAELQAAAITAAEGWKFNPGSRDGQPAAGWITVPVMFSLGGDVKPCRAGQVHALKAPFACVPATPATSA